MACQVPQVSQGDLLPTERSATATIWESNGLGAGDPARESTRDPATDLQHVLAAHRQELQRLLLDWSHRQDRLLGQAQAVSPPPPTPPGAETSFGPRAGPRTVPPSDAMAGDVALESARSARSDGCNEPIGDDPAAREDGATAIEAGAVSVEKQPTPPQFAFCPSALETSAGTGTGTQKTRTGAAGDKSRVILHNGSFEQLQKEFVSKVEDIQRNLDEGVETLVNEKDSRCLQCLEAFGRSASWHFLCGLVIICNTVFLGITADWYVKNLDEDHNEILEVIEFCFGLFYFVELAIRLAVERMHFIFGPTRNFNILDLLLVVVSILEFAKFSAVNLSYLRMLRLMKMTKIMRAVRVMPVFHELSLVVDSILGSADTMFCALVLLVSCAFMFGICFVQAATNNLRGEDPLVGADRDELLDFWGSLGSAILTLFMSTTGGADWGDMAAPLKKIGWHYYVLFCFYIGFFLFVLANTLTSIFVDSVASYANDDANEVIHDQMERRHEILGKLTAIFRLLDIDVSGEITYEEFCEVMVNDRIKAFATSLGLETLDLHQFFSMLSKGGKHKVDLESFVTGCIRLRGNARSMDLMELMMSQRRAETSRLAFEHSCITELDELKRLIPLVSLSAPGMPVDGLAADSASKGLGIRFR